jgi:hypothetical protein
MPRPFLSARILLLLVVCAAGLPSPAWGARGGEFTLRIVDSETKQPIAARMHLKDQRKRPVQPPDVPFWKDHFAVDGEITFKLKTGHYTFEIERGPEYRMFTGYFEIRDDAKDARTVELQRFADLAKAGWYSGDLHVHRPLKDIELLMRADDLYVCPVITWWRNKSRNVAPPKPLVGLTPFGQNRFFHGGAGEDEREGGALLYFNLEQPLELADATAEYPTPAKFLLDAKQQPGAHVDIEKPFWWDVPVWLASGRVDSIGLAHNHLWREGLLDNEAWGKPRDRTLYPPPAGIGRWSETIYHHLLNAGLRIPPSAGSASGVLPNPVGYNRVYVHCGEKMDYDQWFKNLRAGKVVVTNGPLMDVSVEGERPGHVFQCDPDTQREFEITLTLSTRERIEYLEIIQNGRPLHTIRLEEYRDSKGRLPKVPFTESGWFLLRVVTNNQDTHRFASTGPFYVEFDYQPRISCESAQFFLDWVVERAHQIKLADPAQRTDVLRYHRAARDFWQKRVESANAD